MTHDHPLTDDQRRDIALAKDRRYDRAFVTGVHSTGIYCRPSCPARATVTRALCDAGYASPSRFYEGTKGSLGMQASDRAKGGAVRIIHWSVIATSLGDMLVAATDKGVCCLAFGEGEAELRARFPKATIEPAGEAFAALFAEVVAAVEQPAGDHSHIPLDVHGTAFQRRCWEALRAIPAGETRTYGEQAAALGQPGASRAVGSANAANAIAVLIPCHRVTPASGGVGGYAYGPEVKAELLRREGAALL